MIPLCLILGDSTGVGTAGALAAQGIRCEVHAREGAPSSEAVRTYQGGSPVEVALIALGSNDADSPDLARNLLALRERVPAMRVTWLAPYDASAAGVVARIAGAYGDAIVPLAAFSSKDGVHPKSYRPIASALHWGANTTRFGPMPAAVRSPPASPPAPAYRQAVVLSF
ncbi:MULTISPECIES: hypothetical protein [unclassified Sphingomonas]|uniref:hypothetical protein n=1 Tax=unclassified Sphingomonas TaxID=196159 RepID=UPI002269FA4A|nr:MULTISPECIES: hypothetical protein [unclassified Sphingomonas]